MSSYVALPEHLIALPNYPGYFWNYKEEELYSIKITGVLRKLKKREAKTVISFMMRNPKFQFRYTKDAKFCWTISHQGRNRTLFDPELKALKKEHSVVPYDQTV